jgi:hypothetical protein
VTASKRVFMFAFPEYKETLITPGAAIFRDEYLINIACQRTSATLANVSLILCVNGIMKLQLFFVNLRLMK